MAITARIVGPFRGPSGYDRLTREFARGLDALGVRMQLVPVADWSPDLPHAEDVWLERHLEELAADVVVQFLMPDRCAPRSGVPSANYTMFEAARIPPGWVRRAAEHDLVIVPTDACRAAWCDSGVPSAKLRVCGLGVDAAFAEPGPRLQLVAHRGRTVDGYSRRFLHIGELRPRKNHLGLLRAWLRATTSDDDAILLLKCVAPPHLAADFRSDAAHMQAEIGRSFADAAPVLLINSPFGHVDMRALYRTATHYISMSHGEGWDLPMMEAAAAGLSLLAPDHSTYRAYLGPDDATWIPCSQVEARAEGRAGAEDLGYFRGLRWWQPDEAVTADILAHIIASGESRRPPTERMLADFSWARASRRLLDVLGELVP